jgi:hypothetical protein
MTQRSTNQKIKNNPMIKKWVFKNDMIFLISTISEITPLSRQAFLLDTPKFLKGGWLNPKILIITYSLKNLLSGNKTFSPS